MNRPIVSPGLSKKLDDTDRETIAAKVDLLPKVTKDGRRYVTVKGVDGGKVKGGTVTVRGAGSKVADGSLEAANVDCKAAKPIITAENREAGAVVNRVTVFDGVDWSEQVIKTGRPTLKWNGAKGESQVRVVDMDRPQPTIIWQGTTTSSFIVYPPDAAPLRIGMPYRVEVSEPDGKTFAALFSIDPDLEVSDTLLSRVVTVNR